MVVFGKVVLFGQGGFIREKLCIRAKVVVLGKKWLNSCNVSVFG